jgi:hypothetical protein
VASTLCNVTLLSFFNIGATLTNDIASIPVHNRKLDGIRCTLIMFNSDHDPTAFTVNKLLPLSFTVAVTRGGFCLPLDHDDAILSPMNGVSLIALVNAPVRASGMSFGSA